MQFDVENACEIARLENVGNRVAKCASVRRWKMTLMNRQLGGYHGPRGLRSGTASHDSLVPVTLERILPAAREYPIYSRNSIS